MENLTMPNFLKKDFSAFNFDFENKFDQKEINALNLLKECANNTILVCNGKVFLKNVDKNLSISTQEIASEEKTDKILFLNKEFLNSSLNIATKKNFKHKKLNILFVANGQKFHKTNLVFEQGSEIEIFEKVVSFGELKLNYHLNVIAKPNSHAKYVVFEDIEDGESNVFAHTFKLDSDANFDFKLLNLSKANVMNLTYGDLLGKGSQVNVETFAFAGGKTVFKNLIMLTHLARETTSDMNNIAVVNGHGNITIDGIGKIEKSFGKSDAGQHSKIVLLEESALATVNPQLIINEFDVKAGHAAAVGGLDPEQIYYLQSRGLSKAQATSLLVFSYASKLFEVLPENEKQIATELIAKLIEK
ncbi:MAG: SufB/SufD family protein [Christensenellales bacterium]|jgi:Fe-S cluster assembly protein SufD